MFQTVAISNVANACSKQTFTSDKVNNNPTTTSSNRQAHNERYAKYVKEFNEIPKRADRFFWCSQLIGTAIGALGGLFAMHKGQILTSAKEATIVGAAIGWFLSFCVGLDKKSNVVEKQNNLTQNYLKLEEEYLKQKGVL